MNSSAEDSPIIKQLETLVDQGMSRNTASKVVVHWFLRPAKNLSLDFSNKAIPENVEYLVFG